jgi:hypothetical protein
MVTAVAALVLRRSLFVRIDRVRGPRMGLSRTFDGILLLGVHLFLHILARHTYASVGLVKRAIDMPNIEEPFA